MGPQNALSLVARITLRDPSKVELHPWPLERDRPLLGVQSHHPVSDQTLRRSDLIGQGEHPPLARLTPEPNQRPDRHVERPSRLLRNEARTLEDSEEVAGNGDRPATRPAAKAIKLAIPSIVAHAGVQLGDTLERGGARFLSDLTAWGVHHEAGVDAHVVFRIGEAG